MPTPTNLQNVDDRGYVFVTEAADCQIVSRAVTVDNAPDVIPIPQDTAGNPVNLPCRRRIYLKNFTTSDIDVFVGAADVSSTNGYPIAQGEELILDVTDAIQLYAVASADGADLRSLELA